VASVAAGSARASVRRWNLAYPYFLRVAKPHASTGQQLDTCFAVVFYLYPPRTIGPFHETRPPNCAHPNERSHWPRQVVGTGPSQVSAFGVSKAPPGASSYTCATLRVRSGPGLTLYGPHIRILGQLGMGYPSSECLFVLFL
jgi:hypothetical protein